MDLVILQADLERDKEVLITTLRNYLTPASDENRFNWLYRENPYGRTYAWLARDRASGEIVGSSAAFRRRATINGESRSGWVLGDFCVADKYRSLGPALQLQRATLSALDGLGESEFCYDFPSQRLAAIYRRLGISPAAQMVRLAKPLRLDQKVQQRIGSKLLARPLGHLGNLLLQISDCRMGNAKGWEIAIHEGECDNEFTAFSETKPARGHMEIQRSAEYLNWRYLRHPIFSYRVLTARKAGKLQGYLVFTCTQQDAQIEEWCVADDTALLAALVGNLVRRLRETRIATLSAFLLDSDPRLPLLRKIGFWPRESSPIMVHWPGSATNPGSGWLLMRGDRDS